MSGSSSSSSSSSLLHTYVVAERCINKLHDIVKKCIVPDIADRTLSRIGKRIGTTTAGLAIDIHLGQIHDEVTPPDENTFEMSVPHGTPLVGLLYTMAAFLNGPAITDKKKNEMDGQQRGFYVTVTINPHDFDGIREEDYYEAFGEAFQKVWVEEGYGEKVSVIALDGSYHGDRYDNVGEIDLHTFTTRDFASWFSNKLAIGCMLWLKLNKAVAQATTGGVEDKVMVDAMAKRHTKGGSLMLMFSSDEDEEEKVSRAAVVTQLIAEKDAKEKDEDKEKDEETAPFTQIKRSLLRMPSMPWKESKGKSDGYASA